MIFIKIFFICNSEEERFSWKRFWTFMLNISLGLEYFYTADSFHFQVEFLLLFYWSHMTISDQLLQCKTFHHTNSCDWLGNLIYTWKLKREWRGSSKWKEKQSMFNAAVYVGFVAFSKIPVSTSTAVMSILSTFSFSSCWNSKSSSFPKTTFQGLHTHFNIIDIMSVLSR